MQKNYTHSFKNFKYSYVNQMCIIFVGTLLAGSAQAIKKKRTVIFYSLQK